MTISYASRIVAKDKIPASLGLRGGYELRVIGFLSAVWPFQTEDALDSAARGVDVMKRKYRDLWETMAEVNLTPKAVADIIVSTILDEMVEQPPSRT
jgi:hypothetical protein